MEEKTRSTSFLNEIVKLIVPAFVGAVSAVIVAYLSFANQAREIDLKMVDTALAILSGDKGGETTPDDGEYIIARTFALRALKKYSGVDISEDDINTWAKSDKPLLSGHFSTVQSQLLPPDFKNFIFGEGKYLQLDCNTRKEALETLQLTDEAKATALKRLDDFKANYCHQP